jgi:hypothetical protein
MFILLIFLKIGDMASETKDQLPCEKLKKEHLLFYLMSLACLKGYSD